MTGPPRSIAAALGLGASRLASASETPQLDAELLLAGICGRHRAHLLSHGEEALDAAQAEAFARLVSRRAAGEPLAYVLGTRDFWTLTLEVDRSVLVPRPETELLVELALEAGDAAASTATTRLIDLGTGSGAIALAIACERPVWQVTATDRSVAALALARRNAARVGAANVEFLSGDWLSAAPGRSFDVIVSNPPYIAAGDPVLERAPLCFEPRGALTDEGDGLRHLLCIAGGARTQLAAHGVLILEHAPDQALPLRLALESRGYRHVRSHRDLAGRERATCAAAPESV